MLHSHHLVFWPPQCGCLFQMFFPPVHPTHHARTVLLENLQWLPAAKQSESKSPTLHSSSLSADLAFPLPAPQTPRWSTVISLLPLNLGSLAPLPRMSLLHLSAFHCPSKSMTHTCKALGGRTLLNVAQSHPSCQERQARDDGYSRRCFWSTCSVPSPVVSDLLCNLT